MSKKWTRRSALALIGSGAGLLTWGTGGFTEVQGDRDVSLDTGKDPYGLVAFYGWPVSGSPGDQIELFDLANNFGDDAMSVNEIDITSASGNLTTGDLNNVNYPSSIDSDATGTVTGKLSEGANGGSGQISFEIDVSHKEISTILDRTVGLTVEIDYGDSTNYRDANKGDANQPDDPSGNIENPGAVNKDDGESATAISNRGGQAAKVGYSLPTVPQSGNYKLEVVVPSGGPTLTGTWVVYLVNGNGNRLTNDRTLSKDENVYSLNQDINSSDERTNISNNRDDLYLIFTTSSNGNKNSVDIDYFEVRSV